MDQLSTPVKVQILGVNAAGLESGNAGITSGRVLPWLQDTASEDAWGKWQVTYRDVVILDPDGYRVGVYNLTAHDLSDAANFVELEKLLVDAASAP